MQLTENKRGKGRKREYRREKMCMIIRKREEGIAGEREEEEEGKKIEEIGENKL